MLSPTQSVVIVGGTGGFGLSLAQWAVRLGARHLVLASRNGLKTAADREAVVALRAKGVQVLIKPLDASCGEAVAALLRDVNKMAPIGSIIHAAAILRDAPLPTQTAAAFNDVLAAKAQAAFHLHQYSLAYATLRHFILLSSISACVGINSQVNYAAANYFLDQLATHRRAMGLPGTAVNLGLLGDYAGMSKVRNDVKGLSQLLQQQGILRMPCHIVERQLELALLHGGGSRVTALLDWRSLSLTFPAVESDTRFRLIFTNKQGTFGSGGSAASGSRGLLHSLLEEREDAAAATMVLETELLSTLSKMLSADLGPSSRTTTMNKLGLDSLSFTQLRSWISKHLAVNYPVMQLVKVRYSVALGIQNICVCALIGFFF